MQQSWNSNRRTSCVVVQNCGWYALGRLRPAQSCSRLPACCHPMVHHSMIEQQAVCKTYGCDVALCSCGICMHMACSGLPC